MKFPGPVSHGDDSFLAAGVKFRNDIVVGPGGSQIVLEDPAGNPVELFQNAGSW